jgi:hypothetical protein
MCPAGCRSRIPKTWQAGFLPARFKARSCDPQHREVEKLIREHSQPARDAKRSSAATRSCCAVESHHLRAHGRDPRLEARIRSFELAFRMQLERPTRFDIGKEPAHIRAMYGEHVHGRQTLIARRLLERGVRFVQLWHGAGQPWDHHDNIEANIANTSREIDRPIAALMTDLKQRGMFETR